MGLLMVMTLALLVYGVIERRIRKQLAKQNETIPNQINQPTATPTAKWVFQLMNGISCVLIKTDEEILYFWDGMTKLRQFILELIGGSTLGLYQVSSA